MAENEDETHNENAARGEDHEDHAQDEAREINAVPMAELLGSNELQQTR
jgi:hypothetical protein